MRTKARSKEEFIDILRLSQGEVSRILEMLAEREKDLGSHEKRSEPRVAHSGHPVILVEISYPTGSIGTYRAISRNISSMGLGFLHGKFVYPGSGCQILVRMQSGKPVALVGSVVRCRHIEGRVHEVGVRFDTPVRLDDFILAADAPADTPSPAQNTPADAEGERDTPEPESYDAPAE